MLVQAHSTNQMLCRHPQLATISLTKVTNSRLPLLSFSSSSNILLVTNRTTTSPNKMLSINSNSLPLPSRLLKVRTRALSQKIAMQLPPKFNNLPFPHSSRCKCQLSPLASRCLNRCSSTNLTPISSSSNMEAEART